MPSSPLRIIPKSATAEAKRKSSELSPEVGPIDVEDLADAFNRLTVPNATATSIDDGQSVEPQSGHGQSDDGAAS